jgi:hypothetical protein
MNELERDLKAARLAAPSSAFDHRMNELFAAAAHSRPSRRKATLPWWLAGLTAFGAAAASLLVAPLPHPLPPAPIDYRIEAQGRMRQLLLDPPTNANQLPRFVMSDSVP